jgi:hypothetical protein
VSPGQIAYMDEIALAGPPGGRVICAEDLKRRTATGCGINCERYKMSFGIVPFAQLSIRICPAGALK